MVTAYRKQLSDCRTSEVPPLRLMFLQRTVTSDPCSSTIAEPWRDASAIFFGTVTGLNQPPPMTTNLAADVLAGGDDRDGGASADAACVWAVGPAVGFVRSVTAFPAQGHGAQNSGVRRTLSATRYRAQRAVRREMRPS